MTVKWNLRMVAAQRDIWRPTQLMKAFAKVGFEPSLSKVAALWSNQPVTVRLDDLDKICAALDCSVGDLLQAEQVAATQTEKEVRAASERPAAGAPVVKPRGAGQRRPLPPN
jgi:DNA-binding Xre family transcriptional regulator